MITLKIKIQQTVHASVANGGTGLTTRVSKFDVLLNEIRRKCTNSIDTIERKICRITFQFCDNQSINKNFLVKSEGEYLSAINFEIMLF